MSWPIRAALLWKVLVLGLAGVAHGQPDQWRACCQAFQTYRTSENPDRTIARLARRQDATRECMTMALDALRLERARTTCAICGPANTNLGRVNLEANPATAAAIVCLEELLAPH